MKRVKNPVPEIKENIKYIYQRSYKDVPNQNELVNPDSIQIQDNIGAMLVQRRNVGDVDTM